MKNPFAVRREEIGITQRAVAETVGVLPQSVNAWETGKYLPRPYMYDLVATAYQKSRAWVAQAVMELDAEKVKQPA